MRTITLLIIHCSGSRCDKRYTFEQCRHDHIHHNHWDDIGYHYYIELDGTVHTGRLESIKGAHVKDHNAHSIGICYEGGLRAEVDPINHKLLTLNPSDTRTPAQKASLLTLLKQLKTRYPRAIIVSHHTFNPQKPCPCFDAEKEYASL